MRTGKREEVSAGEGGREGGGRRVRVGDGQADCEEADEGGTDR